MGGDSSAAASAEASPALTVDILDEMHVHPVYGLLSERRGPSGMQAAGPEGPRAASRLGAIAQHLREHGGKVLPMLPRDELCDCCCKPD